MTAIACNLGAFDAAERRRYDELRARLSPLRAGIREAPEGCKDFLRAALGKS